MAERDHQHEEEDDKDHHVEEAERYQLGKILGESCNGIVYEALDTATNEKVAVKKIKAETSEENFAEVELLKSLKHANIIELKDSFSYKGSFHLVFELMNHNLEQITSDPDIIISTAHIKSYMKMMLEGVAYCHENSVLHRNLKLNNLVIAHDGTLKLADFSSARKFDERRGPEIDIEAVRTVFSRLMLAKQRLKGEELQKQLEKMDTAFQTAPLLGFVFPEAGIEALDLLSKMCNREERISAKKALEHRYFSSDPPPMDPAFLSKPVLEMSMTELSLLKELASTSEVCDMFEEKSKQSEKIQPVEVDEGPWIQMGDIIGKGSFGAVYEGMDTKTQKKVAVKTRLPGTKGYRAYRSLTTEMDMFKVLQENRSEHKNIIKCLGGWESQQSNVYIVFELMKTDLQTIIYDKNIIISHADVKSYVLMMLQGLEYCHKKEVMHRDLKPNNLLIGDDGQLKLADFGRGCKFSDLGSEDTYEICNRCYRAPELFLDYKQYGPAIDIWSAGCIFAELMLRRRLFKGESDIDQLAKIFEVLGTGTIPKWSDWLSKYSKFRGNTYKAKPLSSLIPTASEDALELLSRMFIYDPDERISSTNALQHRYFQTDPAPTVPSKLPRPASKNAPLAPVVSKNRDNVYEEFFGTISTPSETGQEGRQESVVRR